MLWRTRLWGAELFWRFHKGSGGPGGWWILYEPELHLGPDVLVPDLAGWRRERVPVIPNAAYWTIKPDWLCEVLSPSTRKIDLGLKRDIYAREGIPYMWLVDPLAQVLEAFKLQDGRLGASRAGVGRPGGVLTALRCRQLPAGRIVGGF